MHRTLPPILYALGLAGLVPFVGCAIGAVTRPDPQALPWLLALVGYGAVILAFLGGVHWGFVLQRRADDVATPAARDDTARLVFGVAPSLVGWAALLAAVVVAPEVALAILVAGFAATVVAEAQFRRRGLVPPGYMAVRWLLSAIVVAVLSVVVILRLIGAEVVF